MTENLTTTMVYRHGGQEHQQLTRVTVAQLKGEKIFVIKVDENRIFAKNLNTI